MAEVDPTENPATPDWRSGITEANRSGVAKFDSVDALAGSYAELERAYSGTVKLPTDKTSPEERSSFYTRLGRPDTSDGYVRPDLPDGNGYDEDLIGGMQTAAFDEGLTSDQFSKLIQRYLAIQGKKDEAKEAESARAEEETDRSLRELWHVNYEKNIEVSRRAMRELIKGDLGEQFKTVIEDSGLGNNSVFIQGFSEIGKQILNDTLITSDGTPPKLDDDYTPSHVHSPEMYRNAEDEEGKKARAWFVKRGHMY